MWPRIFRVSIATAASFAAVFAFTFAIIQPVLGAIADIFGKARLMIVCLVLLGLANILGAMATSFPLLFASRILAGIGSGGVFPVSLGLTSDLVGPEKRQIAIEPHAGGRDDRQSAGCFGVRPDRRLYRLARRARRAWRAGRGGLDRGGGRISRRRADASAADQPVGAHARLSHDFHQSECAHLLRGRVHRRLLRARAVSLHRGLPVRTRRNLALDRRHRHRGLRGRRAVLHPDGVAVSAADRRQRA